MMGTSETIATEDAHMPPFFTKTPISIERGEGVFVWDEEGKRYLDLTAGWGVTSIGHATRDRRAGGAGRASSEPDRAGVLAGAGAAAGTSPASCRRTTRSSSPTAAPRPTTPRQTRKVTGQPW
jgi:hypothetical protein